MKVSRVMSTPVVSANPRTTIRDAAKLMRDHDIGALPVLENGQLVGMVTDRDIVVRILAQHRDIDETRLGDAMSPGAISCFADQDVAHAAATMGEAQVRRILVMDRSQTLLGLLSIGDIAENVSEELAGEGLGEICEDR
jgi:CBS domain-containing protein